MKITIINGPNLNLTGKREADIYGSKDFDQIISELKSQFPKIEIKYLQSNVEGELINYLHDCIDDDGVILNAGAYTHTSIAIADAVRAIDTPVIEVHMSNVFAREEYRKQSYIASACVGSISGFGADSYRLALLSLTKDF